MKDILKNMALIHLNEFAKENKVDIAGTYVSKDGRGFRYSLRKQTNDEPVADITFHKMSVPTFSIHV